MKRPLFSLLNLGLLSLLGLACSPSSQEPAADATTAQLLDWASRRAADGALNEATTGYRRALQRDSLEVAALLGLAHVYDLQERKGPADRYRRRAFHQHYGRALEFISRGAADSARVDLKAAIEIIPRHPLARLRLGELHREAGSLDTAIIHFEAAVEANPRYSESLTILARAYIDADEMEKAERAFEKAIEVNINTMDAYLGLGEILSERRDWAAAAAQYEKALLINPRSPIALHGLEQARTHL